LICEQRVVERDGVLLTLHLMCRMQIGEPIAKEIIGLDEGRVVHN
jgi:hypothetical protein